MLDCNCGKDQTPKEVFDFLKSAKGVIRGKDAATGLGLFLVPDPEAGVLEEKVVLVHNLTYEECAKRGDNCIAYKWIPAAFKSAEEVLKERGSCGQWCGPDRDWCPWGCFCGSGNYCR
jgi:hypothetical protein